MYSDVSNEFKEIVKSNSITASYYINFPNRDLTILPYATQNLNSSLIDLTIKDVCIKDGVILGSTMIKEVEIKIINKDDLDLADQEFELYVGVKLSDESYEYIPYGKFVITEYSDTKSNNIYKIIAYDYMSKLNSNFTDNTSFNPQYPITLKNFKEQLLTYLGIEYETQTLPNDNFAIDFQNSEEANLALNGFTNRALLGRIAELQGCFVKVNRNNKIQFYRIKDYTEDYEDETKYAEIPAQAMNSSLEINKRYGPINIVSLTMSNVKGENVVSPMDEYARNSISTYGETEIEIKDNPFTYTQALREAAMEELYPAIRGFRYIPTKFNYKAYMYLDSLDLIKVYDVNSEEYVNSVVLNQTIKIPATRQSSMENTALTKTQVSNKYYSKSEQEGKHTEFEVNKAKQEIKSIVSQIGDRSQKTSTITQDIDKIESEISEIGGITKTETGNGTIEMDNINTSEPIYILVHPDRTDIKALHPSQGLHPRVGLRPHSRELYFINTTDNTTRKHNIPKDLLWLNNTVYDEYVIDYTNQLCYITHKVGIDENGNKYALGIPTTEYFTPYPLIPLTEGNYTITLKSNLDAYIKATLMSNNIYTNQFATKYELSSSITQTKNEINLSVDAKFSNYSTTLEMNSAINISAEQISSTVSRTYETKSDATSKKNVLQSQITQNASEIALRVKNSDYTHAELVARINDNTSEVLIHADKVNLSGYLTISSANSTYASKSGLSSGTTTINGGCITTGTIDASKVSVIKLNASNITTGTLSASKISGGSLNLTGTNTTITSTNFSVTKDGAITSKSGTIGGFTISTSKLYNGKSSISASTAGVYIGTDGISLGSGNTFKVTSAGVLNCSNIFATGGQIGGIDLNQNGLSYSGDSSDVGFGLWKNGVHQSFGSSIIFHAGGNNSNIGGAKFRVFADGTMVADKAYINGEINSSTISGSTISGSTISGGTVNATTINVARMNLTESQSSITYNGSSLYNGAFAFTDGLGRSISFAIFNGLIYNIFRS